MRPWYERKDRSDRPSWEPQPLRLPLPPPGWEEEQRHRRQQQQDEGEREERGVWILEM